MPNEPTPGSPFELLRLIIGDLPASWVKLLATGALIAWAVIAVGDFKREVKAEGQAVRSSLETYIAANRAWQDASVAERNFLLGRVNARFQRIYTNNGWVYEPIEPR